MLSQPVYRIAFDVPLRQGFDYLAPAEGASPVPGSRVVAPFGRKRAIGIVLESLPASDLPPERLKPIGAVCDPEPVFDPQLFALLRWCSEYYHHPLGEVLAAALPKTLRAVRRKPALSRIWVRLLRSRAFIACRPGPIALRTCPIRLEMRRRGL